MHSPPVSPASSRDDSFLKRLLLVALSVFMAVAWFGGGPTVDVGSTDEWLMLLALPLVALAGALLLFQLPASRFVRSALLLALLVPVIPMLQLLPLPESMWEWSSVHRLVAADLRIAGIEPISYPWTMWPESTIRALLALLPALACFVGALALGDAPNRRLVPLLLGLILANLAFGLFQVGLPPNSAMRLYTDNGSGIGGVLVNGNHQGTALIVGMLLALGMWARERVRRRDDGQRQGLVAIGYAAVSLVCLVAVALTGSSAAMLIAIMAYAIAVVATGLLSIRRIRSSRGGMVAGIAVAALLVLGLLSAQGWLNLEQTDAVRYELAREATALGLGHAPFGSGAGTFVDSFAQSASPLFQRGEYVNHAHNEFAQWWFEAGWLGLLLMGLVLGLVAASGWRLMRGRRRDPVAIACWLAVVTMLAHSWVDFPLRTISLMSLAAFMCGFVVTAADGRATSVEHAPAVVPQA